MDNESIIDSLIQEVIKLSEEIDALNQKINEISTEEWELIDKYRTGFKGVYWSTDDFETKAFEIECDTDIEHTEYESPKLIYDRSKFKEALDMMIYNHDAKQGINWYTIEFYLDDYCKIK